MFRTNTLHSVFYKLPAEEMLSLTQRRPWFILFPVLLKALIVRDVWLLRGGLLPLSLYSARLMRSKICPPNRYHLPHYLWCNDAGQRLVIISSHYGIGQLIMIDQFTSLPWFGVLWYQHNTISLFPFPYELLPSSTSNCCHLVVCMGEKSSPWRFLGERNPPLW